MTVIASFVRTNLTAVDWARAALKVMVARGMDAVTVAASARQRNVSKGSFDWHAPYRDASCHAAITPWKLSEAEAVFERIGDAPASYQRLFHVFAQASAGMRAGGGTIY